MFKRVHSTVEVGQQVEFVIVVINNCDCDLTDVYVIDDDYSQEISWFLLMN